MLADVLPRRTRELLHQQRQVVEQSPNPIAIADLTGRLTYVNPAFVQLWGYDSAAEVVGRHSSEFAESAQEVIAKILDARGVWSGEVQCVRKQGGHFFARVSTSVTRNAKGKPTGMIGAFNELTELKASEQALAFREDQLEQVVRVSQIGVFDHDIDTNVVYWSPQARLIFDFDPEGVVPMSTVIERIVPDDLKRVERAVEKSYDPSGDGLLDVEFCITRRDGTHRWIDSHSQTFFRDGKPWRTVGGARDITAMRQAEEERVKLLERLTQAEKLESIGRLAGGIAHDFNNMLAVILGSVELAIQELDGDHPVQEDLREMRAAASRSAELTRQLLAFARRQTIAPTVQNLNENVTSSLRMLQRLIGEGINLVWEPSTSPWSVRVDSSQVSQVLTNLTVNARDALNGVGEIRIRTTNIVVRSDMAARNADATPGEYVRLSVSDNGQGMDAETLSHIFEPFFTTKETGRGTGLGLAMVYGIARQNGGFVTVESTSGTGTSVSLHLPRHADAAEASASPVRSKLVGGNERIIVVEDELMVRQMTTRMLQSLGYTVVAAATPTEALRLVEFAETDFDLAVLDVVMPEMTGVELCRRLFELRPTLACIFVSGYPGPISTSRHVIEDGVPYLQKPFTSEDLARTVRAALDNRK